MLLNCCNVAADDVGVTVVTLLIDGDCECECTAYVWWRLANGIVNANGSRVVAFSSPFRPLFTCNDGWLMLIASTGRKSRV